MKNLSQRVVMKLAELCQPAHLLSDGSRPKSGDAGRACQTLALLSYAKAIDSR